MPDYRHPLQFGIFPSPDAAAANEILELARTADELGLDLIGIQDHPYQARHLDAWTLISTVAARTSRLRMFLDVADLPLRPPAMLAKATASLDVLSGGRVELGLGAGTFWDAIEAMDGTRRSPGEAVAALEEAITVCRLMWGRGAFGALRRQALPPARGAPRPGPGAPHRRLARCDRTADARAHRTRRGRLGAVLALRPPGPDPGRAGPHRRRRHRRRARRDPRQVRRIYNVFGVIDDRGRGLMQGPPAQWVDELTGLAVEHGMDSFVFGPSTDPVAQTRRFAEEVAPAVREAVDRHRGQ